jgi:uncharacterized protein YxjI
MRKQLFAIGDDYWVEDEQGQRVFRVDGKVLRIRQTFVLEDAAGTPLATIKKPLVSFRDRMDVEMGDGSHLRIQGNITEHEYDVLRDDQPIAAISKKWFSIRDTYAVDVSPQEYVPLILALTVAVDWMGHLEHEEH